MKEVGVQLIGCMSTLRRSDGLDAACTFRYSHWPRKLAKTNGGTQRLSYSIMMLSIIIIGSSCVNGKRNQLDGGPDAVILTTNGSRDWDDRYGTAE